MKPQHTTQARRRAGDAVPSTTSHFSRGGKRPREDSHGGAQAAAAVRSSTPKDTRRPETGGRSRGDTPATPPSDSTTQERRRPAQRQRPSPNHGSRPLQRSTSAGRPVAHAVAAAAAAAPATVSSASPTTTPRLSHPFRANFNDHFETSLAALRDVLPVVTELRQLLRPSTPERLTVYDPYYCAGGVVRAWAELGVHHVLHENRDFYADVAGGTVPGPFDVLVTNPPFSEDHIWRLLAFLVTQSPLRPWAFVAPDYIASKPQYKAWVRANFTPAPPPPPSPPPPGRAASRHCYGSPTASSTARGTLTAAAAARIPSIACILPPLPEDAEDADGNGGGTGAAEAHTCAATVGPEPFYLVPRVRYDYQHPLGVGHEHSHFKSMWYVWAGQHTRDVLRAVTVALAGRGRSLTAPSQSAAAGGGGTSPVAVVHGIDSLMHGHHVTAMDARPNPQRRQATTAGRAGGYR